MSLWRLLNWHRNYMNHLHPLTSTHRFCFSVYCTSGHSNCAIRRHSSSSEETTSAVIWRNTSHLSRNVSNSQSCSLPEVRHSECTIKRAASIFCENRTPPLFLPLPAFLQHLHTWDALSHLVIFPFKSWCVFPRGWIFFYSMSRELFSRARFVSRYNKKLFHV